MLSPFFNLRILMIFLVDTIFCFSIPRIKTHFFHKNIFFLLSARHQTNRRSCAFLGSHLPLNCLLLQPFSNILCMKYHTISNEVGMERNLQVYIPTAVSHPILPTVALLESHSESLGLLHTQVNILTYSFMYF